MRIDDNPVRIARIKAGLSQRAAADAAGIDRSSLVQIEDGRTKAPASAILRDLEVTFNAPAGSLNDGLKVWRARRRKDGVLADLVPAARAILAMSPTELGTRFTDFIDWRSCIADTPTRFAVLLGVPHETVRRFEAGLTGRMPDAIQRGILNALQVTPEYLVALSDLPVDAETSA